MRVRLTAKQIKENWRRRILPFVQRKYGDDLAARRQSFAEYVDELARNNFAAKYVLDNIDQPRENR